MPELPERVVSGLNELGFALCEGDEPYVFTRFTTSGEHRLLIQAVGVEGWRVGLAFRALNEPGRLPNPFLAIPLHHFASSADGTTVEVTTDELATEVPDVLEGCVFAFWDAPPE